MSLEHRSTTRPGLDKLSLVLATLFNAPTLYANNDPGLSRRGKTQQFNAIRHLGGNPWRGERANAAILQVDMKLFNFSRVASFLRRAELEPTTVRQRRCS